MTRARDLANFVSNAQGDVRFDTDTLFIDSSANSIGIGNTAPSRPLHITANPAMIMLEDSDGGSNDKKAQIQVDTGAFEVNARNDDDSSRTDNILVADLGTGNVGIGIAPFANSLGKSLDIVNGVGLFGSGNNSYFSTNAHYDSAWKYKATDEAAFIGLESASFRFNTAASGTAGTAITFNESARIDSDGLKFNGDTAAANALNDYEEGSWTPAFDSGYSSITYAVQVGSYTKIGDTVRAYFRVYMSSATTTGDVVRINGLPYASVNNGHVYTTGTHYTNSASAGGEHSKLLVEFR